MRNVLGITSSTRTIRTRQQDIRRLIVPILNVLPLVNRLPPELLCRIVKCVLYGQADARSLIPLAFVSRYWCKFIVSEPWNWTLISSSSYDLVKLSLQRAEGAPLRVCLDVDKVWESLELSALINCCIRNAVVLRFSGIRTTSQLTETLQDLPRSTSNLRSLGPRNKGQEFSVDPFKPFPPTLDYLKLADVPRHPSLLCVTSLTELVLRQRRLHLPMDALLDFLKRNQLLKRADLDAAFTEPSLHNSERPAAIVKELRHLSITWNHTEADNILLANLPLSPGAHLEFIANNESPSEMYLTGAPVARFMNQLSPNLMEYESYGRSIRPLGPNGSFSFRRPGHEYDAFEEFHLLPLNGIRKFRQNRRVGMWMPGVDHIELKEHLPALETLAIDRGLDASGLFGDLLPNSIGLPSLRTLAFPNYAFPEGSMEALMKLVSDCHKDAMTKLDRIVIVDSKGNFPGDPLIDALTKHVLVDLLVDERLDLGTIGASVKRGEG